MKTIKTTEDLKEAIALLELSSAEQWPELKTHLLETYETLKPLNFIKSTFNEITSSPEFKTNIVGTSMGLTAGYLSKLLVFGHSKNPVKILIGDFLQVGISNLVANNTTQISRISSGILRLFKKKSNADHTEMNTTP